MKVLFTAAHIGDHVREEGRARLHPYLETLRGVRDGGGYESPEGSINLPSDEEQIARVEELAREKATGVQRVIVVGIGGSNMGTAAIVEALKPIRDVREMLFLEGVEEQQLRDLREVLLLTERPEDVLVCVISKSGKTTETVASADILLELMNERFGVNADTLSRFVVITNRNSPLWESAEERGLALLEIPQPVGGRYSVFSSVGLFPLAAAGFDVRELVKGAREMRDFIVSEGDPATLSAIFLAHHSRNGYSIHDTFLFDSTLETLGKWYRQLLGESIGKQFNVKGEEVREGITPTVSIGSRDLHSVGQLSLAGPRDKITVFVAREPTRSEHFTVPENGPFSSSVPEVRGKGAHEIMTALAEGAMSAYREAGLPFIEARFESDKSDEYDLGAFMQWRMIETMLLAHLLGVNAFDQGAVEAFKAATRALLEKNT